MDIYADGSTQHDTGKEQNVIKGKLLTGANGYKHWCKTHKMHIIFLIQPQRRLAVNLEDQLIKTADAQKLLGMIIDNNLNWT